MCVGLWQIALYGLCWRGEGDIHILTWLYLYIYNQASGSNSGTLIFFYGHAHLVHYALIHH
jgi:hypothetical protein